MVHEYEPGSTFKVVSMAAVLEHGKVHPDDRFNYAPDNFLQLPQERYLVYGRTHYEVSDNVRLYGKAGSGGGTPGCDYFINPEQMAVDAAGTSGIVSWWESPCSVRAKLACSVQQTRDLVVAGQVWVSRSEGAVRFQVARKRVDRA